MLKIAIASFLQHLQTQNTWAQAMLQPYAGQSILVDATLVKAHWLILETGEFTLAGETASPDATISTSPSNLLRLAMKDESAKADVKVEGDTALATALAKVINGLRWDVTDDLSHLVGDVVSNKIAKSVTNINAGAKDSAINLKEMLREYLVEEAMLIAKPTQVENFNTTVDTLKADTARLAKRIEQLHKKITAS